MGYSSFYQEATLDGLAFRSIKDTDRSAKLIATSIEIEETYIYFYRNVHISYNHGTKQTLLLDSAGEHERENEILADIKNPLENGGNVHVQFRTVGIKTIPRKRL